MCINFTLEFKFRRDRVQDVLRSPFAVNGSSRARWDILSLWESRTRNGTQSSCIVHNINLPHTFCRYLVAYIRISSFNSFCLFALALAPPSYFPIFLLASSNLMIYISSIGIVVCRREKLHCKIQSVRAIEIAAETGHVHTARWIVCTQTILPV